MRIYPRDKGKKPAHPYLLARSEVRKFPKPKKTEAEMAQESQEYFEYYLLYIII